MKKPPHTDCYETRLSRLSYERCPSLGHRFLRVGPDFSDSAAMLLYQKQSPPIFAAEDVKHAFDVISHDREAHLGLCSALPRNRKRGCPKMRYFNVANGCSTVDRRSRMTSGVAR